MLAIDQGTSATKAVVVADDGTVMPMAEAAIQIRAGRPHLAAIGLTNQGETRRSRRPIRGCCTACAARSRPTYRPLVGHRFDLDKGEWSDRACAIFGIDIDSLASVTGNARLLCALDGKAVAAVVVASLS